MVQQQKILFEIQYLPSIQYFSKWFLYEQIILEQHENYAKGSYRNRCHIAAANGLQRLSIPLNKGKNEQQSIREVQISHTTPWQSQHWSTIQSAYGNAPFFEYYADDFATYFEQKQTHLFEFNYGLIELLVEAIGLDQKTAFSSRYEKKPHEKTLDFRNKISPKAKMKGMDTHFKTQAYTQVFEEKLGFLENLSILDLLFCKGPETILYLENSVVPLAE